MDHKLPTMFVTVDCVPVRCLPGKEPELLLIQRHHDPYGGSWALPGGFVEVEEDLPDAAARELEEETGISAVILEQVGSWGTPGRDPRGRVVTIAFLAIVERDRVKAAAGEEVRAVQWCPLGDPPELAFDHTDIISTAVRRLKDHCRSTHLGFAFLGGEFTVRECAELYESMLGLAPGAETMEQIEQWALVSRVPESPEPLTADTALRCTADSYLEPLKRTLPCAFEEMTDQP